MIYILSGLTGLLILVALFTFIHKRRHSEDPETIVAPPADSLHPSSGRSRRMADQPGKKRNQSPLNPASGSDRVNPLTGFQISISLKFPALICIADNDGTRNIPGLVL